MKKIVVLITIIAAYCSLSYAQTNNTDSLAKSSWGNAGDGNYEERVSFGAIIENTSIKYEKINYKMIGHDYDIKMNYWPLFGIGAHMPIKNWIGLNGIVGYQRMSFNYKIKDNTLSDSLLSEPEFFRDYVESDFNYNMYTNNLIAQIGVELGIPIYSDYASQQMFKLLMYGSGILGKTFYENNTKFRNANIWGFAYGFGVRYAIRMLSITAGTRSSLNKWTSYIKAEHRYISDLDETYDKNSEIFEVEYKTFLNPYLKITISFI